MHRGFASSPASSEASDLTMRRPALALTFVVLAACGGGEKDLKSTASWSATALVVARYWEAGEVPDAYAQRALRKAAEELAKGPLPEAAAPVDDLRQAVARHDREAARELIRDLSRR